MKKFPQFPWFLLLLYFLLPPSKHLYPKGVYSMISWRWKRSLEPGWVVQNIMYAPPESGKLSTTTPSQDISEGQWVWGKSPQWIEFHVCTCIHLLGKKMAICNYIMGNKKWSGWMNNDSEGTCLENWWWRHLGNRYVDRLLHIGKVYEDIWVPWKCLPKGDFSRRKSSR